MTEATAGLIAQIIPVFMLAMVLEYGINIWRPGEVSVDGKTTARTHNRNVLRALTAVLIASSIELVLLLDTVNNHGTPDSLPLWALVLRWAGALIGLFGPVVITVLSLRTKWGVD